MSESNENRVFHVNEEQAGQRIDKCLAVFADHLSRARIQDVMAKNHVLVNGAACTTRSYKVKEGDEIRISMPPLEAADPVPQDIPLNIVYEDDHLIVLNKPVGLVVHQGAGHRDGTLVNALLHYCGDSLSGIGGVLRPGIVHRLDKDTSGLMIVAKSDQAHQGLSDQLADRSLSRVYECLALGIPTPPKGIVDMPLGRDRSNRMKMAIVRTGGKDARTRYRILGRFGNALSHLECQLETGRTHQIRVHMNFLGCPIIGDPLYKPQPTKLMSIINKNIEDIELKKKIVHCKTQLLHAKSIKFIHPVTGESHAYESDLPENFQAIINFLTAHEQAV